MRSSLAIMVAIMVATSLALAVAARRVSAQDDDLPAYASVASHVLGTHAPRSRDHAPEAMAAAAHRFLASLDADLRARVVHALDSPERRRWTNLPARPDAGGVRLGDCARGQVEALCDLMACLFSGQGYTKMRDIMLADDQLLRGGRPNRGFGAESFSVVIFGEPSATEPWAFQIDGHHVGVNLAIHGERMTMSPSFIGTQPAVFRLGTQEIRPLSGEIDDAFALVNRLSAEQRAEAIIGPRRGRIRSGPGRDDRVPQMQGVSCGSFDEAQVKLLRSLIAQWVNDLPSDRSERRMKQLGGEIGAMRFAWHGPTEPGSDVSFSIQGPTLIIEYAGQDLGGNPLDHLHTMYRDPTNEYGGQLAKTP